MGYIDKTTFIQFIHLYNESDYPFTNGMSGYILSLKILNLKFVSHENNIFTIVNSGKMVYNSK